jgi:hypothetical protein
MSTRGARQHARFSNGDDPDRGVTGQGHPHQDGCQKEGRGEGQDHLGYACSGHNCGKFEPQSIYPSL